MNKATLIGYHGRKNLGDDLFLRIASLWLKEYYDINRIYVAGLIGHVPKNIRNIELQAYEIENFPTARFVWLQTFFYAMRSQVVLFSAGSIFTIQPFLLIFFILSLIRLLKPKMPIIALGVSIGPFKNSFDSYWCGRLLLIFDEIVLRDKESEMALHKINPLIKSKLAYDLALTLNFPKNDFYSIKNSVIGLCLNKDIADRRNSNNLEKTIVESLVSVIGSICIKDKTINIIIFAVCADDKDGDIKVALELQKQLAAINVDAILNIYDGVHPEEYVSEFSKCTSIITSRMHTGILAMMQEVPVLQIAYAKKINDFYNHCNLGMNDVIQPSEIDEKKFEYFLLKGLSGKLASQSAFRRERLAQCGAFVEKSMIESAFRY